MKLFYWQTPLRLYTNALIPPAPHPLPLFPIVHETVFYASGIFVSLKGNLIEQNR